MFTLNAAFSATLYVCYSTSLWRFYGDCLQIYSESPSLTFDGGHPFVYQKTRRLYGNTYEVFKKMEKILAYLATWRFKSPVFLCVLCVSAVHLYGIRFCTFGGFLPCIRHVHTGGGFTGASRRSCAISADTAGSPAATKCHFGECTGASRLSFQRNFVKYGDAIYCKVQTVCVIYYKTFRKRGFCRQSCLKCACCEPYAHHKGSPA